MNTRNNEEYGAYGATIMRISLGVVLIAHSLYLKLVVFTLPGTAAFFQSIGLPGWLAYTVFAVEAVAGVFLVVGYKTRLSALVVIPVLLGATWAHLPNGWLFTAQNGGWEYPLFLALIAVSVGLVGPGAFALESDGLDLRSAGPQTLQKA